MKLKKKILGILSLIAVIAITIIANSIPNPANAEEITQITHEIVVSVYDKFPEVTVNNLVSDQVLLEDEYTLEYDYVNTKRIEFEVIDENGTVQEAWTDDLGYFDPLTVPTGSLTHTISLKYLEMGDYTLHYIAYGGADTLTYEDTIPFSYLKAHIKLIGFDDNNNPIFEVDYSDAMVGSMEFNIYDSNGKPLYDPALIFSGDVEDSRYSILDGPQEIAEGISRIRITIPMPKSADSGDYYVSVLPFDESGEELNRPYLSHFAFVLPPDVPDTGSFSILQNIAQTDFLITGLLIFFIASIAGLIILTRKKRA